MKFREYMNEESIDSPKRKYLVTNRKGASIIDADGEHTAGDLVKLFSKFPPDTKVLFDAGYNNVDMVIKN
jgi:hypothetical protein